MNFDRYKQEAAQVIQHIWTEDQLHGNGLYAKVFKNGDPNPSGLTAEQRRNGFVLVDAGTDRDPDKNVLLVSIPEHKQRSYDLVKALLDNYEADKMKPENYTDKELQEMSDFLDMAIDSECMKIARQWMESTWGPISDSDWRQEVAETWFGDLLGNTSGFEHVFVGETSGRKLGGYHFWYKYWLDDNIPAGLTGRDDIQFVSYEASGHEVLTLKFKWRPFDFNRGERASRDKFIEKKPVGGFFVGCSPECLFAMGVVGCQLLKKLGRTATDLKAQVGEGTYNLKLVREDLGYLKTFYPIIIQTSHSI